MLFNKREVNCFSPLSEMMDCTSKAAVRLDLLIKNYADVTSVAEKTAAIKEVENRCDQIFREFARSLAHATGMPINREDILSIASAIDDVTDAIEGCAVLFYLLSIRDMRDMAVEMSQVILRSCEALTAAVHEFERYKTSTLLTDLIRRVNDCEEEGDRLYQKIIKQLYLEETDPIKIIKWKEIYDVMEDVLDSCEDVADLLGSVALKYC